MPRTTGPGRSTALTRGADAPPYTEPVTGDAIVSHYQLLERTGSDGMGVVYRARDLRLDRVVALKFLPAAFSEDAHAKRRFLTEARAAAALDHSNVCTVHEIGETPDGQLFIAMAFVDGPSLRQLIERGPVPLEQAIDIARQIASALEGAHGRGIVHRDIKPANVIVGTDGVAKLVDFGSESDAEVLHAILQSEPPPLRALRTDVPPELEHIVARALDRDPDRRFSSASEMRAALRHVGVTTGAHTAEGAIAWLPAEVPAAIAAGEAKPARARNLAFDEHRGSRATHRRA